MTSMLDQPTCYQVLARKWRPRTLTDLVGQEPIVRMLTNAFTQSRIHHAYLLTGTRGVGKTTLGRIFAKCLNCETGMTATPCGVCMTCQAVDNGQSLDLYEIDAASRTGVDDMRELLQNVLYPPVTGRYKIYLIDEVHMLSNHSFNALLKTLEEPPEHVKFLLATTDPKKIPVTILSRCLQLHLRRIDQTLIAKHLANICTAEGWSFEEEALLKLGNAAAGSMRDALSLLDQAIAYGNGAVNLADVLAMLGAVSETDILPLIGALAAQDGIKLIQLIDELKVKGAEFSFLFEEVIGIFHRIALKQVVAQMTIDPPVQALVAHFSPEVVQLYYQIALLGRRDLQIHPDAAQCFEMTFLRMLAFKPVAQQQTCLIPPPVVEKLEIKQQPALSVAVASATIDWRALLLELKLTGMAYALASNCSLHSYVPGHITLVVAGSHAPMLNPALKERIREALTKHFNQPMRLDISVGEDKGMLETPAKQMVTEQAAHVQKARDEILSNPKIKELIDLYDATLDVTVS